MKKYRISKYNPKYRNDNWIEIYKTWTSASDIGNTYNGLAFSVDDYLETEKKYLHVIDSILNYFNIDSLTVKNSEFFFNIEEIKKMLLSKNIYLTEDEIDFLKIIKDNSELNRDNLNKAFKFVLRECFWATFENNEKKIKTEFGYDYYVYIWCENISYEIIKESLNNGIYIEEIQSLQIYE